MGFLASKTVVYITFQMEFLHSADLVLVLREGEIVQAGDHRDLLQTGTEFSTLFEAQKKAIEHMQLNSNKRNGDEHLSNGESTIMKIPNPKPVFPGKLLEHTTTRRRI